MYQFNEYNLWSKVLQASSDAKEHAKQANVNIGLQSGKKKSSKIFQFLFNNHLKTFKIKFL